MPTNNHSRSGCGVLPAGIPMPHGIARTFAEECWNGTFRGRTSITILFFVILSLTQTGYAQQAGNVTLDSSEQLFCVLAALNASGYDTGVNMDTGSDTR